MMKLIKRSSAVIMLVVMMISVIPFTPINTETVTASTSDDGKFVLIDGNSNWKYNDSNTDQGTTWKEESFNDSSWKYSFGPFGYPAADYNSTFGKVSDGTIVENQEKPNAYITYYFRRTFTVEDVKKFNEIDITAGIDDGYVMYINGTEVRRQYMPEGEITWQTPASYVNEPSSSQGTDTADITSSALPVLKDGVNTIAVEMHNRDNNSSDIYFDMEMTAGLIPDEPAQSSETTETNDPTQPDEPEIEDVKGNLDFTITSPYDDVDWNNFNQYKANFHTHSTNSDGSNTTAQMIENYYAKGFDILTMTDHNYTTVDWDQVNKGAVTTERMNEIRAGVGRDGTGMIGLPYGNEQSLSDHLNTFFADFNNVSGATLEGNIKQCEQLGGISQINHPGRYTGAAGKYGDDGAAISNDPAKVAKYVDLFTRYSSCIGMEIINKKDGDSAADRILWDNILKQTMPNGRFVWGLSNDDSHSTSAAGFSYNWMLMPENTIEETRKSMESGTFYAVAKVSVRELGANFVAVGEPPRITDIEINQSADSIKIEGYDYNSIEWIADGEIIATGSQIDLNAFEDKVNSYVRAQLKGDGGIAFTQPFMVEAEEIEEVPEITGITVTAPTKTVYEIGEDINLSGIKVMKIFSDATTEEIPVENITITGFISTNPGTVTVTVSYDADGNTFTDSFDITVNEPVIEKIEVTAPTKTIYEIGEDINLSGIKVIKVLSDATTEEVPLENVNVTGFDSSESGTAEVTVSYEADGQIFTAIFNVNILPIPTAEATILTKSETIIMEETNQIVYYFAIGNENELNALDVTFNYNSTVMTFNNAELTSSNGVFMMTKEEENAVRLIAGTIYPVALNKYTNIIKLTFDIVETDELSVNATLTVSEATFTPIRTHEELDFILANDKVTVEIRSIKDLCDLNRDGTVTIADLSIALTYYRTASSDANWSTSKIADVNLDGIVDSTDFTIIMINIQ